MYGALNLRSGSTLASSRSGRRFVLVGPARIADVIEPAEAVQPGGHERGRHREVGADVLLARQRLLDLGEPLFVVVEVFLVVHGDARGGLEFGDEPVGHIQRPVGDAQGAAGGSGVLGRRGRGAAGLVAAAARGQERRAEGQRRRSRGAAAEESPARGPVGGESGEEPGINLIGHGDCAFREFRGRRDGLRGRRSGAFEHLL